MGVLNDRLNEFYKIRLGLVHEASAGTALLECSGSWVVAEVQDCIYWPSVGDLVLFVLIDQKVHILKKYFGGK